MHEQAVTENLLEIVLRHAARESADRVTDCYIVVDQLTSIVDDSVQFYWDLVSAGTLAAGARLHFDRRPATVLCQACRHTFALGREIGPCPHCGSERLQIESAGDFRLESIGIVVVDPEAAPP